METKADVDGWRLQRQKCMSARRFLPYDGDRASCFINQQQVEEAAKLFATKKDQRKELLRKLTCTFGTDPKLAQYFIKINTSLPTLISLLSGHDAEMQMESLYCLTNLAAAAEHDTDLICKMTAPYLVTYLSGNNPLLQDQCAWCVGNLVNDNEDRANYLVSLGVLHLLVQLLQSTSTPVIQSCAFALVNFAKFTNALSNIFMEDPLPAIELFLEVKEDNYPLLLEMAWLLFYLTAKSEYLGHIKLTQIPEKTASCFTNITKTSIQKSEIITPLVRSLANICCVTELTPRVLQQHGVLTSISELISNAPDSHLRKESLWLLTNIAANSVYGEAIMTSGLLRNIIYSLASTTDIKIQACQCLCNLLSHSQEWCDCACREGTIQCLVPLINHPDVRVIKAALWLTELLITKPERLQIFNSSHGREALESTIQREECGVCQQVTTMARDLLMQYYK